MRDKNTSARLCAKNAGGAYAQGGGRGAYLRDTTVSPLRFVEYRHSLLFYSGALTTGSRASEALLWQSLNNVMTNQEA